MNKTTLAGMNPKKILFKNYITEREWNSGVVLSGENPNSLEELTREFRVKSSKLCEGIYQSRYLNNSI